LAKRILIYTNHFFPEQFKINEIVNWLDDGENHIRVITGLPNYPSGKIYKGYFKSYKNYNIIINRLLLIPRGNGSSIMMVLNYCSYFMSTLLFTIYISIFKKKYDYIFVHHTSPILIAIHPKIYSIFHKTKKYLWDLDIWPETLTAMNIIKSKWSYLLIEKLVIWIYSTYDLILVGSKSFEPLIKKRFKNKIMYFPNWAENQIENNEKSIKDNMKFLPNEKKIIMYTGNIGFAQGFSKLIPIIDELKTVAYWVFIGDGRFKNRFASLIKEKNLNNCVKFIDPVNISEIPSYISYADCLFLSLKSEDVFSKTVPAKLQTYMALAKPVLAVISGEGASIVKEAKCGFVEEENNFENLVILIRKINSLTKKDLYTLGLNGKKYYDVHFSSDIRKKQLLKLFK
tara:strand:+ start:13 stop:1209 length:1197 start_codon:yes stop_codon:yes gene_type:complete